MNGPPLRSIAFSTIIKEKPPASLKSARIQPTATDMSSINTPVATSIGTQAVNKSGTLYSSNCNANTFHSPMSKSNNGGNNIENAAISSVKSNCYLASPPNMLTTSKQEPMGNNEVSRSCEVGNVNAKVGSGIGSLTAKQSASGANKIGEESFTTGHQKNPEGMKSLHDLLSPSSKISKRFNTATPKTGVTIGGSPQGLVSRSSMAAIDGYQQVLTRKAQAFEPPSNVPTNQNMATGKYNPC